MRVQVFRVWGSGFQKALGPEPNSAELRSFLLTICRQAPESTTNSVSSGSFVDAVGSTHSSAGKWNVASTPCFGQHRFLSCSLHRTCPQISLRRDFADLGFLTCIFPSDGTFFSWILASRSVDFCESHPLNWFQDFLHWISLRSSSRETSASDSCGTQPNCDTLFTIATTFLSSLSFLFVGIVAFLWLFVSLFINLMMREQTLFPGFTSRFIFTELTLGRAPILTRRSLASTFQIISARLSENGTRVTFASDTFVPRHTSTSCHRWLRRCDGFRCRFFLCMIVTPVSETAFVSLRTLAFFFNAYKSLSILDHCSCFNSPISGVKIW